MRRIPLLEDWEGARKCLAMNLRQGVFNPKYLCSQAMKSELMKKGFTLSAEEGEEEIEVVITIHLSKSKKASSADCFIVQQCTKYRIKIE